MTLSEYLRTEGQTCRQFAARLGCDAAQVNRWANGRRLPTLEMCLRIKVATGGLVSANDFLPADAGDDVDALAEVTASQTVSVAT